MRMVITFHVDKMIKENPNITADDVMIEIDEKALQVLCSNGFTIEEIEETIKDVINKCKK